MAANSQDERYPFLYDPSTIFTVDNEMCGPANATLGIWFYNSRNVHGGECNYPEDHAEGRRQYYSVNAGAAQLYKKSTAGMYEPYLIPGQENKQYHCLSFPIGYTQFGHSERILIKDILEDLIASLQIDGGDQEGLPRRPSYFAADLSDANARQTKALQNLAENLDLQNAYKDFLQKNQFKIKIWSERPQCDACEVFMRNVCPEGSSYGHIIPNEKELANYKEYLILKWQDFRRAYDDFTQKAVAVEDKGDRGDACAEEVE